jgi:hypothetical protein
MGDVATPRSELLAIYLTDHLAGAAAGSRRMKRLADAERTAADGPLLIAVADEIEQDRQVLQGLLRNEGLSTRWYKRAAARVAEVLGVLKTNGRVFSRSPLTGLVELEAMRMGVAGKLDLWHTLLRTDLSTRNDIPTLIDRAERQLATLGAAHDRRAAELAASGFG